MRNVIETMMAPLARLGRKEKSATSRRRVSKSRLEGLAVTGYRQQRAPRRDVFSRCTLTWAPNGLVEGTVLNISKTGILVRFPGGRSVPAEVRMRIPVHGINATAKKVRKTDHDYAFKFQ
ncbi:MAG: PilZ domain-containing protein [Pseudomonadota bacterium]